MAGAGATISRNFDWAAKPFGILFDPRLRRSGRWILFSVGIGVVSGSGAILLDLLFRLAQRLLLEGLGRFRPPASGLERGAGFGPENLWLLPLPLVVGGLLSGAVVFRFSECSPVATSS